jgi:ParB family transcriptional regulator, chromosome partitioning protein
MSPEKPRRLGRGLEALINSRSSSGMESSPAREQPEFRRLSVSRIRPNPFQPRREFPEGELAELRASLQVSGMLQPVVVRAAGDGFELISGERRLRAAIQLHWSEIPALVREADEQTMLTLALIENLQRADLNMVDEAKGYFRLHEEFHLTHQQIADAVGKDRSTVTNLLRILSLPTAIQHLLEHASLTLGHAKVLLGISDTKIAIQLANEIVGNQLTVRETERRVRKAMTSPAASSASASSTKASTPDDAKQAVPFATRHVEDRLRRHFQTDIRIRAGTGGRGSIEIAFFSNQDLARLIDLILGPQEPGD